MKKILSLILAGVTVASVLTSCAHVRDRLDSAITLASSDAQTYAVWLDGRLDDIPTDVIVGIGSNEEYGVDMSSFHEDGYILRSIGNDTLIFGATADGLDRAVRAYAKAADNGTAEQLNTVFGEGAYIEKLTIGGRDIADFTILYEYDEEISNASANSPAFGNTKYAAEEFRRLCEIATGITLPIEKLSESNLTDKFIKIEYYTEGDLGANGATYAVENGNVYMKGVGRAGGCANAVYHFFEKCCGWDGLIFGDSWLREADTVDVPDGINTVVDPMFDYIGTSNILYDVPDSDKGEFSLGYCGDVAPAADSVNKWSGYDNDGRNMCYTDADLFSSTYENIRSYVKGQLDNGKVIGRDIVSIDLGMADSGEWCSCSACLELCSREGTNSAAMVQFGNRIIEKLYEDDLGGVIFTIRAYHGSNIPPKTVKPHSDLWVTFCDDGACINHGLRGTECNSIGHDGYETATAETNNARFAEWLKGWCDITDNVYYCHHDITGSFCSYPALSSVYDDMHFLSEIGVKGFILDTPNRGEGFGRLRTELLSAVIYNPDATEAEFEIMKNQLMEREYGDGFEYVKEFIALAQRSAHNDSCRDCGDSSGWISADGWDMDFYADHAADMETLLLEAKKRACTSAQEDRITRLLCEVYYRECFAQYFKAEAADDELLMRSLEKKYGLFVDALTSTDFATDAESLITKYGYVLRDDIHAEADAVWEELRGSFDLESVAHDYDHVVIIGVDGAGRSWNEEDSPFVMDFFADGFTTNMLRVANPTISGYNWGSFFTGVNPQIHGISNSSNPYCKEDYPSFFKLLRKADPDAKIASFANWGYLNNNIIEKDIDIVRGYGSDDEKVFYATMDYLEKNTPELLFVCFDEVDAGGHSGGLLSNNRRNALYRADDYISQIVDFYEEKGIADETLFIVTSDHGHLFEGGHGGQTIQEKYVTFFAKGKTIANNNSNVRFNIRDVAAIVTHALCIDGNEERWDSCIPAGLFTDMPEGQAREIYSTEEHETVPTPSGEMALESYVDTAKLEAALFFDGDITSEYGGATPVAKEDGAFVNGYYGCALDMSKTQYLTFDETSFGTDSFSIALWVKEDIDYDDFDNTALYGNKVITDTDGLGFMFEYAFDSEFYCGNGTDGHYNTFGLPDDFDEKYWYHTLLVVDREAGTVSMYYNFKLNSTHDISKFEGVSFDSELPFIVGADGTGNRGIDAQLDDLLIFNDALSEQEIASLCSYYFG